MSVDLHDVIEVTERDKAYRERAQLVAFLAACYPAEIWTDTDGGGWDVVAVETPAGQMSWHITEADMGLFAHVALRSEEDRYDGHTTEEKYERLARLTKDTALAGAVDEELARRGVAPGDDEYRITAAGRAAADAQAADPKRYALVEQMGHRSTVGSVRETTFAGKQMLELTDMKTGRDHLISPESLYEVTWLTEDEARARATPWTATALPAAAGVQDDDPWPGDDE